MVDPETIGVWSGHVIGVLVILGGIYGYIKAGSKISVITGIAMGIGTGAISFAAQLYPGSPVWWIVQAVWSVIVAVGFLHGAARMLKPKVKPEEVAPLAATAKPEDDAQSRKVNLIIFSVFGAVNLVYALYALYLVIRLYSA
mmetsp:Transcript_23593/g.70875  ORF Transcript_23593/g.70875 Transcript_23593/m.70875 type:complete len:142 (-) Transcript_23593:52-477(-)